MTNYINALNACKALRGVVGIKNPSAEAIATATEAMEKLGKDNYNLLLGSDVGWWQDAVKNQAE